MIYLFGGSGHGLVILDILQRQGKPVIAFVDDADKPPAYGGIPVLKSKDWLPGPGESAIISIGSNAVRRKIAEHLEIDFETAVHPQAVLASSVQIDKGTVVMAGAVMNPFSVIGRHSIINTGAVIDHECRIGDYTHISPHATLCGNVALGDNSWVAAGATVIPNITIGSNVIVGAGSVVIRDVPDNCVVVGNPARIIKSW